MAPFSFQEPFQNISHFFLTPFFLTSYLLHFEFVLRSSVRSAIVKTRSITPAEKIMFQKFYVNKTETRANPCLIMLATL